MNRIPYILLVDDDARDIELTVDALREAGVAATIHTAIGGTDALDFLSALGAHTERAGLPPPHLVLLDLRMGGMDGFQVLRAIKGTPHLRRIPVVVLTTSADEADVARCYDLGANGYVVKPVSHEDLIASAQRLRAYWLELNIPSRRPKDA